MLSSRDIYTNHVTRRPFIFGLWFGREGMAERIKAVLRHLQVKEDDLDVVSFMKTLLLANCPLCLAMGQ